MANKKGLLIVLGGASVVVIISLIYLTHFTRITSPYLCEFCHNTYYDYREYAFNSKAVAAPMPRGLLYGGILYGCAECHRDAFREFKNSDHSKTEKAERPGCQNCHEPHNVINFTRYMFSTSPFLGAKGISEDVMIGSREWESKVKPGWDKKVREGFLKKEDKACKDCHKEKDIDWDLEAHKIAKKEKMTTCIDCHFNLVHKGSPWPEMEAKKEKLGI